jgi:hypothetical protein
MNTGKEKGSTLRFSLVDMAHSMRRALTSTTILLTILSHEKWNTYLKKADVQKRI